jgi:hypothetical protein
MLYPPVALERAMTIREVVLRAMSGEITWIQAAEIIGCTPCTVQITRWARPTSTNADTARSRCDGS